MERTCDSADTGARISGVPCNVGAKTVANDVDAAAVHALVCTEAVDEAAQHGSHHAGVGGRLGVGEPGTGSPVYCDHRQRFLDE